MKESEGKQEKCKNEEAEERQKKRILDGRKEAKEERVRLKVSGRGRGK